MNEDVHEEDGAVPVLGFKLKPKLLKKTYTYIKIINILKTKNL